MAHFAELESKTDPTGFTSDTHLVVKRVVVVGNDCVPSDEHVDGETWCVNFFGGGTWKQTSYNHNFRKQYAGIGYVYNESKNKLTVVMTGKHQLHILTQVYQITRYLGTKIILGGQALKYQTIQNIDGMQILKLG